MHGHPNNKERQRRVLVSVVLLIAALFLVFPRVMDYSSTFRKEAGTCRMFHSVRHIPAGQCWSLNEGSRAAEIKRNQPFRFPEVNRVRYPVEEGLVQIGGAGLTQNGPICALLSRIQAAHGVFGSVGEIGVHHGHYWLALALTARAGEKLFVADLFEDQGSNIDGSGRGDREKFLEGLKLFGIDAVKETIDIRTGLSYTLPMNYAQQNGQGFRLFSVDGGHTAEVAYSDIGWTACNLVPGGIIAVDDHFHPDWPAVTDGIQRYFACGQVELYPFLVVDAPNQKLYLTTKSHHQIYYDALLADNFFGPMFETKQSGSVDYMWNQVKALRLRSCAPETGCAKERLQALQAYWVALMKDNFSS